MSDPNRHNTEHTKLMITNNTAPPTAPPIITFSSDASSSSPSNKIVTVYINLTCIYIYVVI